MKKKRKMSADLLDDLVQNVGVKDTNGLKSALSATIARFKKKEHEESLKQSHLDRISEEYFVGWKIKELSVGGKVPPRDDIHEYDSRVESGDMILAKYSTRPHIRVILIDNSGRTFKLGIVVDYRQQLSRTHIAFTNFRLSVGVEADTVHEEERKVVIQSIFSYLQKHHYRFVNNLEYRFHNLCAHVIFHAKSESC